jgi:G patch domain-containing protein 1
LHVLEKNATKEKPVSKADEAAQAALVTQMPIVAARNTIEWAPEPLLCKRFGIPDPYANRSRPDVSQYKFRTDVLALDATSAKAQADAPKYLDAGAPKKKAAERTKKSLVAVPPPPPDQVDIPPPPPSPPREPDQAAYVEKPMGLFKAIFENSDDDIDEEENENEIEADLEAIQTSLGEKPPKLAPAKPDENNRPVWSSTVMSKSSRRDHSPERDDRDSSRRKRSKREKKDKRDRKDRKERRSKSSRKDSRKHRKRSRRDYDSSSSSYSD